MTVLVIVPVLHRPHRAGPLALSLHDATPEPHRLLFVCSRSDQAEQDAVHDTGSEMLIVADHPRGDYPRKINEAVRSSTEPLLFLAADDLHFHPGWLPAACERLAPGIGVVGTNDMCSRRVMRGDHATHSLVTRAYAQHGTIDDTSRLLHEGYWHEHVDDELVGTAKHRNAWAFAAESIVEHLHPMNGKAPSDALYEAQAARMAQSRPLYEQRRHLWT